jgi:hypothetical protein
MRARPRRCSAACGEWSNPESCHRPARQPSLASVADACHLWCAADGRRIERVEEALCRAGHQLRRRGRSHAALGRSGDTDDGCARRRRADDAGWRPTAGLLAALAVCIAVLAADNMSQDARARCRPQVVICGILYGGHARHKNHSKQTLRRAYSASAQVPPIALSTHSLVHTPHGQGDIRLRKTEIAEQVRRQVQEQVQAAQEAPDAALMEPSVSGAQGGASTYGRDAEEKGDEERRLASIQRPPAPLLRRSAW